jgi:hypothetical protein
MNEQDITLLSQYMDGELPADERARLDERLADDAALRSGLERLEELNRQVRSLCSVGDSVPGAVSELLSGATPAPAKTGEVLRFPGSARPTREGRLRWPLALAASVVAAIGAGILIETGGPSQAMLPGNDAVVSAALDQHLSGDGWVALADGRELQPVLTFPNREGGWCREYLLRGGDNDWRAVACRDEGRWVTQAAGLESFIDPDQGYRPAGSGDAAPVAVFISDHAADIALDRDAEAALIAEWRR